jgi:hypothetical protein
MASDINQSPLARAHLHFANAVAQSPQVQTQLKLKADIGNSPQIQAQMRLAGQIEGSPRMVAQRKKLEEKLPAQKKSKLDEKKSLQGKFEEPVQAKGPKEEKLTQRRSLDEKKLVQRRVATAGVPAQLEEAPPRPNRTGLPDQLKAGVEHLSGLALDDVKVHYGSAKPAQLNALAYAQGTDIHVAPGQEKHLPHEAWHIVQQKQGRVRPTMQMKSGIPVNDDAGLEAEADVMGAKALK